MVPMQMLRIIISALKWTVRPLPPGLGRGLDRGAPGPGSWPEGPGRLAEAGQVILRYLAMERMLERMKMQAANTTYTSDTYSRNGRRFSQVCFDPILSSHILNQFLLWMIALLRFNGGSKLLLCLYFFICCVDLLALSFRIIPLKKIYEVEGMGS